MRVKVFFTRAERIERMGSGIENVSSVFFVQPLAHAAKIAGFTTQETLALSASMSSVGIQAEAGGTAMEQTMKGIQAAISAATAEGATKKAKENLETLAKVAGVSSEEFTEAWKTKPMQALSDFINGLARVKEEGGDTFAVLDDLGFGVFSGEAHVDHVAEVHGAGTVGREGALTVDTVVDVDTFVCAVRADADAAAHMDNDDIDISHIHVEVSCKTADHGLLV